MNKPPTAENVAAWMVAELRRAKEIHQQDVVNAISSRFGRQFTYINANGNPAISTDVLKAFRRLSSDFAVWERGQRLWRLRRSYDRPGRQQE